MREMFGEVSGKTWAIVLAIVVTIGVVSAWGNAIGANGPQNGGPQPEDIRRAKYREILVQQAHLCADAELYGVDINGCARLVPTKN